MPARDEANAMANEQLFTEDELRAGEFFRTYTRDSKGRDVYVGLDYEESKFLKDHQRDFANRHQWTQEERKRVHATREEASNCKAPDHRNRDLRSRK